MCLSKREREFIEDWLSYIEGEITLMQFVEKWKSESKDWKVYMRVLRHRISKKYDAMLKDLLLMKKFLDLERHP
ncbi:hypothetical protein [Archaeoglobus veneficus]|uniref:Uncharacterized protein n=1 Tax=Archaeoglobus veneficus (strain DSM 11195 / SNP6) TaxID=693661 RepID=F2KPE2_ARCVS|nr:hypothetical protein [Archaeoglobus veneficus]AEA46373.1 hypothetical protein Arcve_0340 [Archaeoglobus veneficus SNP6]